MASTHTHAHTHTMMAERAKGEAAPPGNTSIFGFVLFLGYSLCSLPHSRAENAAWQQKRGERRNLSTGPTMMTSQWSQAQEGSFHLLPMGLFVGLWVHPELTVKWIQLHASTGRPRVMNIQLTDSSSLRVD